MEWVTTVLFSSLGAKLVGYVLAGGGLVYLVNAFIKGRGYPWDVVRRAMFEVGSAVYEVYQVYTSDILKGRADGNLTQEEKDHAFQLALATAKSNLGAKGLKRLLKVLGLESTAELDKWLGTQIEAKVAELKSPLA
jgi:hypothetical protein